MKQPICLLKAFGVLLIVFVCSAQIAHAVTNTWGMAASMAATRTGHTATLLPSGKVLVAGGETAGNGVLAGAELYDPASNVWSAAASMSTARFGHTATLLPSGRVLVAGGVDNVGGYIGTAVASAEIYDPATNTWVSAGNLNTPRVDHTATLLSSGEILIAGGNNGSNNIGIAAAELFDPVTRTWAGAGNLVQPVWAHTATLLTSGKVLVAGGYNFGNAYANAQLYNPATNSWAGANSLAAAHMDHTATLLTSGKVLVAGGGGVELFDPGTGNWSPAGSLATARRFHTATLLPSGKVLAAGGEGSSGDLASAELYDPTTNSWTAAGSLSIARFSHTAVLLPSGRVLAVGGYSSGLAIVGSAELYDPSVNTWTAAAGMTTKRDSHTATLLPSGNVLVAGGEEGNGSGFVNLSSTEVYNAVANSWSSGGSLACDRSYLQSAPLIAFGRVLVAGGFTLYCSTSSGVLATTELSDSTDTAWIGGGSLNDSRVGHITVLLASGKVLAAGGQDDNGNYPTSSEIYDPSLNTWRVSVGGLAAARSYFSATLLTSGKVLVVGGFGDQQVCYGTNKCVNAALASAELYDPTSDTWSSAGSLTYARQDHAATLLPSGKVLVVAGADPQYDGAGNYAYTPLSSAEIYDPVANAWSVAASLAVARGGPTSTLLQSGKVLVVGGYNNGVLASAELYDPVSNLWSSALSLAQARDSHTATMLPSGAVLIAGGFDGSFSTLTAELYTLDLGFTASQRPVISSVGVTAPIIFGKQLTSSVMTLMVGDVLQLSGSGFTGNGIALPLVQLSRIDNGQIVWASPAANSIFSDSSYTSAPLPALPAGTYAMTMFVNAVPSLAQMFEFSGDRIFKSGFETR